MSKASIRRKRKKQPEQTELFLGIMAGLEETLAYVRGEPTGAKVHRFVETSIGYCRITKVDGENQTIHFSGPGPIDDIVPTLEESGWTVGDPVPIENLIQAGIIGAEFMDALNKR